MNGLVCRMERPFRVSLIGDDAAPQGWAVFCAVAKATGRCLFYKERVEFLLGGDAAFIRAAAAAVRCANKARPNTTARLLLLSAEGDAGDCPDDDCPLDGIERIPPAAGGALPAHLREAVDRADACLFCVAAQAGGAHAALRYATAAQKPCRNLAEDFLP